MERNHSSFAHPPDNSELAKYLRGLPLILEGQQGRFPGNEFLSEGGSPVYPLPYPDSSASVLVDGNMVIIEVHIPDNSGTQETHRYCIRMKSDNATIGPSDVEAFFHLLFSHGGVVPESACQEKFGPEFNVLINYIRSIKKDANAIYQTGKLSTILERRHFALRGIDAYALMMVRTLSAFRKAFCDNPNNPLQIRTSNRNAQLSIWPDLRAIETGDCILIWSSSTGIFRDLAPGNGDGVPRSDLILPMAFVLPKNTTNVQPHTYFLNNALQMTQWIQLHPTDQVCLDHIILQSLEGQYVKDSFIGPDGKVLISPYMSSTKGKIARLLQQNGINDPIIANERFGGYYVP